MSIDRAIRTAGILGFLVPFGLFGGSAAIGVSWDSIPYVLALWPSCVLMMAPGIFDSWTGILWVAFIAFLNASYYILIAVIVHGILHWLNDHFWAGRQKSSQP